MMAEMSMMVMKVMMMLGVGHVESLHLHVLVLLFHVGVFVLHVMGDFSIERELLGLEVVHVFGVGLHVGVVGGDHALGLGLAVLQVVELALVDHDLAHHFGLLGVVFLVHVDQSVLLGVMDSVVVHVLLQMGGVDHEGGIVGVHFVVHGGHGKSVLVDSVLDAVHSGVDMVQLVAHFLLVAHHDGLVALHVSEESGVGVDSVLDVLSLSNGVVQHGGLDGVSFGVFTLHSDLGVDQVPILFDHFVLDVVVDLVVFQQSIDLVQLLSGGVEMAVQLLDFHRVDIVSVVVDVSVVVVGEGVIVVSMSVSMAVVVVLLVSPVGGILLVVIMIVMVVVMIIFDKGVGEGRGDHKS